jgi:integrase
LYLTLADSRLTRKDIYQRSPTNDPNSSDDTVGKYIRNVCTMNKSTAYEYLGRLNNFEAFLLKHYKKNIDQVIKQIIKGDVDPYYILSEYCSYLRNDGSGNNISVLTIKQRIVSAKNFLEYYDVDISPRKFKLKVKLPKSITRYKEALSKEEIVNILNICSDIRLKTYVMLLASTGCRATEALSIRLSDCDLDAAPARMFIRGEYTKTRVDRRIFLTTEMVSQLKAWLDYKYRKRRVCYKGEQAKKTITEYRVIAKNENDLVFAVHYDNDNNISPSNPKYIYSDMAHAFAKTLDRIGMGRKRANDRRRRFTLHTLRRWLKSTISDLGYGDFSEFMIGHAGSVYWQKKESEKAELFLKIEPSLTFLDFPSLERKGADFQSKIDVLEQENLALRQRDSTNTDAIASLSDKMQELMAKVQELERKRL